MKQWFYRMAGNPLMRGGLVIGGGILAGNILGFLRGAVTAYMLGTHAQADGLSIAFGPIDTMNSVLTNTMVFGFVPLLTASHGAERAILFRRVAKIFSWVFCSISAGLLLLAPNIVDFLGPGLLSSVHEQAVNLLRISSVSTLAIGAAALYSALLYTERRFGPSAFYQAIVNLFVIAGALTLTKSMGIYSFAVGYTVGAVVHFSLVRFFARRSWKRLSEAPAGGVDSGADHTNVALLSKPGSFVTYAMLLSANTIATRAFATQAGPGMAAAFDYSLRCVNVVIAYLISPTSNSLLPEIARLRSEDRARDAFRLINRTLGMAAIIAVVSYAIGILLREPIIALLFQRGHFTAESTRLVSGVFLGFAPSLIGVSLLEIMARSLFALDRPWIPVIAACVPVTLNILISRALHTSVPEQIGWGSSVGLIAGFLVLFFLVLSQRKKWMRQLHADAAQPA